MQGSLFIDLSIIASIPKDSISEASFGDIAVSVLVNQFEATASFGSSAFSLDLPITLPGGNEVFNFGITDSTFSLDFFVRNSSPIDILELFSDQQDDASLNLDYGGTLDAYLPLTIGMADVNMGVQLTVQDTNLFEPNPVVDYRIDLCDVRASVTDLFDQLKTQIVAVIESPFEGLNVAVNIDKITDPLVEKVDSALQDFTSGVNVALSAEDCSRRLEEVMAPSNSPSTSSSPTSLPPGFSLVGDGYCLDASNRLYSYLGEVFPAGISDMECINWCAQQLHPEFVGVEIDRRLESSQNAVLCNCNFGRGQVPSDLTYFDYNPDATHSETEPGTGEIVSSNGDTAEVCYVSIFYSYRVLYYQMCNTNIYALLSAIHPSQ